MVDMNRRISSTGLPTLLVVPSTVQIAIAISDIADEQEESNIQYSMAVGHRKRQ
jgi:hypothetical protein